MINKKLIMLVAIVSSALWAMEETVPYEQIPFRTPEQIQQQLEPVPQDIKEDVDAWNREHGDLIEEFVDLPGTGVEYNASLQRRAHFRQPHANPRDLGKLNHLFKTKKAIIRIPGLQNALIERVSAMGADPYNRQQVQAIGGYESALRTDKPRHQGISRLLAAYMLQQLNSPAVKTPPVWAYLLKGRSRELDDRNYVMVQRLFPANLVPLDDLTPEQKAEIFKNFPLQDLYNAMKYTALWQFKGDDVYVNPDNIQELWLVDLEKPNNEARDKKAFRNIAVYGEDKGKWRFNVKEHAFPQIRSWINQHAPGRVAEWDQLRANDPDLRD